MPTSQRKPIVCFHVFPFAVCCCCDRHFYLFEQQLQDVEVAEGQMVSDVLHVGMQEIEGRMRKS